MEARQRTRNGSLPRFFFFCPERVQSSFRIGRVRWWDCFRQTHHARECGGIEPFNFEGIAKTWTA